MTMACGEHIGCLKRLCSEQWQLLGRNTKLLRMVEKYGVRDLIGRGLEAGVKQREEDWAAEMEIFQLGEREH